jgi:hypothetical protein
MSFSCLIITANATWGNGGTGLNHHIFVKIIKKPFFGKPPFGSQFD